MSGARIALLAATGLATLSIDAGASLPTLPLARAVHVAKHIRHREAHNDFGLRARMGGSFKLGHAYCDRDTVRQVTCHYDATGDRSDEDGRQMRCAIDVRVRQVHRVTWKRSISACARQLVP